VWCVPGPVCCIERVLKGLIMASAYTVVTQFLAASLKLPSCCEWYFVAGCSGGCSGCAGLQQSIIPLSMCMTHHHHHQITKLSHSINAIGPAPHRSGRKREQMCMTHV
jgi:hypothetical protein